MLHWDWADAAVGAKVVPPIAMVATAAKKTAGKRRVFD
jgi:hypothetical protein